MSQLERTIHSMKAKYFSESQSDYKYGKKLEKKEAYII